MELFAERLKKLPPYLFIEIDKKKKKLIDSGVDVINLGVGDPDLPTPEHIVKSAQNALIKSEFHHYPFGAGTQEFRESVVYWYSKRFNVKLDYKTEVYALIGSKEGIGHLPLALVNPGDYVLIPDPGYPVYKSSTIFAGGNIYQLPLTEKNNFIPDLDTVPEYILNKTKLLFLNYPNNPTTAVVTEDFFIKVVEFAKKYNIVVAHDAAYSEIYFTENVPISFLSVPGAKDIGVEFHSVSKTYNMTGWRLGWICGNPEIIQALGTVKDNYDSGVFTVIQQAGITALTDSQECVAKTRKIFKKRRDIFCERLIKLGWKLKIPDATFYVWTNCPDGYSSTQCVEKLVENAGIIATPGVGMGQYGEGYVRFALTTTEDRLIEATERIAKIKW